MRKSWIWFLLSGMALTTCYEKPEFPIVPEIGLNDFYFFQANDLQDSMIFVIDFTDGDGDVDGIGDGLALRRVPPLGLVSRERTRNARSGPWANRFHKRLGHMGPARPIPGRRGANVRIGRMWTGASLACWHGQVSNFRVSLRRA